MGAAGQNAPNRMEFMPPMLAQTQCQPDEYAMLTIKEIQAAKPKTKPYKLSDGDGLYIEVMPTGSKYWRVPTPLKLLPTNG